MEWQYPEWLYLILPLGALWLALAIYSRRRRQRAAAAFVAQPMWTRILPADSPGRFWAKTLLREAALVAGLVALAGPRFGMEYEDVVPRGSDLYVLIDVSRSMLGEDVPPSRLGRAKADVAALVNRLEGERVGLIAFAGQAVVKCPLTVDYDAFRRSLDELDPNSAPRGGTAIGDAIRKALEVFHGRGNRDQAILLITDGDDQESYPREAAAAAAERHVTIFTIGLGDADHGARIPEATGTKSYLEYQGHQVWTKLDGALLKDIALKTSGVYVPVGTRAYDLGELYAKYLQGRRGAEGETQKRIRRGERFQIFLALAVLALLADALIRPYPRLARTAEGELEPPGEARTGARSRARREATVATALALVATCAGVSRAESPADSVRDGLRLYRQGEFAKAEDRFAAARTELDRKDAAQAAIAAFDQACAAHRKGKVAEAREWYLKAGLARDKRLAASAHFNLGTLSAEEARRLAGEHPETVPPEKRPEILDQLKAAVASFRHCLELEPDNASARRDIELVRQWVKYYGDRWHAADREKRRKDMSLLAFVEFLMESQTALEESVKALGATASADDYFELKRLEDELREEIGPLKEKIKAELQPPPQTGSGGAPQADPRQVQQGIALLEGWASAAGEKMASASAQLDRRRAGPAASDQRAAVEELEKIWEAVIPFHPLLARDLADQTHIAGALAPEPATQASEDPAKTRAEPAKPPAQKNRSPSLRTESEDLAPLTRTQERTHRRTQLLKLKAEAERQRLEKAPTAPQPKDKGAAGPTPEQLKAGYQKAIELAPRAVAQMELALKGLRQKDRQSAYPPAEEARKILEEIQKAQPKDEQKDQKDEEKKEDEKKKKEDEKKDQQKQDQQKKEEQKKDQQKQDQQKKDEQKKDQQKKDEQKKDEQKKDEQKKDEQKKDEQKKDQESGKSDAQRKEQPQPQLSRDQIESALRKVRERQQEKRERDRMIRARAIGRAPVEKDW